MNLGLFTYKMGLKNHPHLTGPLWLKRAAALSGPGTASGPGKGSENESRFHTMGIAYRETQQEGARRVSRSRVERGRMCRTEELGQLWREAHCFQSRNVSSRSASHLPGAILGAGGRKVMGFTS